MGIVRKDLTTDDLLLTDKGDVVVTYTSKWNLVDERLNRRAVNEFYAAPGKIFKLKIFYYFKHKNLK